VCVCVCVCVQDENIIYVQNSGKQISFVRKRYTLDDFELMSVIGKGAFAKVILAQVRTRMDTHTRTHTHTHTHTHAHTHTHTYTHTRYRKKTVGMCTQSKSFVRTS